MTKEQVKAYLDEYIKANKHGGITATVLNSGLTAMLNEAEDALNSALENYYTTGQTYTKDEVNSLVNASMKFIVADELPAVEEADRKAIYLIPSSVSAVTDYYDEYVVVVTGEAPDEELAWEHIGTTQAELDQYAKVVDVEASANTLNTKIEAVSASTVALSAATVGIEENLAALSGSVIDNYATKEEVIANELTVSAAINSLDSRITASTADIAAVSASTVALSASTVGIETNVTNLSASTVGIETNVTNLSASTVAIETNVTNLSASTVGIETNLNNLSASTVAIETNVTNLSAATVGIEENLAALSGSVIDNYATKEEVIANELTVSAAINSLDARITANTADITALSASTVGVEGTLTAHTSDNVRHITAEERALWNSLTALTSEIVSITYADLKDLRDASGLTSGKMYRINDYTTTTVQANTQAAGHDFDIVVLATDVDKLNEYAKVVARSGDTYFTGSTLEAWEIKYCLDNDTNRFAWADTTNGKGVIYYMKDEFENECPYDFKNIQFQRWAVTNVANSKISADALSALQGQFIYSNSNKMYGYLDSNITAGDTTLTVDANTSDYYYTFTYVDENGDVNDATIACQNMENVDSEMDGYRSNKIGHCCDAEYTTSLRFTLGDNTFVMSSSDDIYGTYSNRLGDNCYHNTIGNSFQGNTIGNSFQGNTIGNSIQDNTIGNYFRYNTIGNNFYSNSIGNNVNNNTIGNNFYRNSIGNGFYQNSIGNSFQGNTIGNGFGSNTIGNNVNNNTIGNYFQDNTIGNYFYNNSIGNSVNNNTIGNNFYRNSIGNGVQYITASAATGNIQYLTVLDGTKGTNPSNMLNIMTSGAGTEVDPTVNVVVGASYPQFIGFDSDGALRIKNIMNMSSFS